MSRIQIASLAAALLAVWTAPGGGARAGVLGELPAPGLYDRLVDPAEYPAYHRRAFEVPTWRTFQGRPQLVGGRYHGLNWSIAEKDLVQLPAGDTLDGRDWFIGRVYRPNLSILHIPEPAFSQGLGQLRDAGMYLFNVGGYGPGSPWKGSFGQCEVTPAQMQALSGILGERFLGFDLGEQDGRYHNAFQAYQLPSPRDAVGQHRLFRDWCDRTIDDQGGRLTLLTVLWGWHYPVQDGAMGLIGAECQNKFGVTNPQVQYAFLRGAGKQYGILWYGDVSVFSTFGVTGWSLNDAGELVVKPGGGSANLMRRLFLSQWLWNSCILGFEGSTVAKGRDGQAARPSPIGIAQLALERKLQEGFSPGVMQTPVALLCDYLSGWMPARTNRCQFTVWNNLPYSAGDYLTDRLLSCLYPGYEDCGWYMDERGAMSPTPYGDIADCLLNDAPSEVLSRYSLILCSGLTTDTSGTRDRLERYLQGGGTVLAVGDDAARLWPEWCAATTRPVPAGTTVQWQGDTSDMEEDPFALHDLTPPAGSQVLATCAGRPAVVRIPRGAGTLILLGAATGMNAAPLPCKPGGHPMWGGENTGLERPYRLLAHARRAYDEALRAQRLFTAGDGLTVTTCRRDERTFTVGVSNPGLTRRPFAITSHLGAVSSITEVDLGPAIQDLPGYWPHRWGRFDSKQNRRDDLGEIRGETAPADPRFIGGGDMRLFTVVLARPAARTLPHWKLPPAPRDRLLRVPDLVTLRERLLSWPGFAALFDGVAVGQRALQECDPQWLHDHAGWFERHGVRILVDARDAGAGVLPGLVESLGALRGARDLLTDHADARLAERCAALGIRIRSTRDVHIVGAGAARRATGGVQILEADWRSWDAVYRDARAAWLDPKLGRIAGPPPPAAATTTGRAAARKERCYLALHGIDRIEAAVAERPGLLERFNGLMLDVEWLLARSTASLGREREWLGGAGLDVVVDFSRSLNRFPDLTFAAGVPHRYEASVRMLDSALQKMRLLGATQAVIGSHASAETGDDWADQRRGIERFLDRAAEAGVTVHWRSNSTRPPRSLAAAAALVAELRRTHPNLRLAAGTVDEPDPRRLTSALQGAGGAELWLLAAPAADGRPGVSFLPLATLSPEALAGIGRAAAGAPVVFDADYRSWAETVADADLWAAAHR